MQFDINPCEINVIITTVTNLLFTNLSKEEFASLSVFFNELSKSMFSTIIFRDICEKSKSDNN